MARPPKRITIGEPDTSAYFTIDARPVSRAFDPDQELTAITFVGSGWARNPFPAQAEWTQDEIREARDFFAALLDEEQSDG